MHAAPPLQRHVPVVHVSPAPQSRPQPPQFVTSVLVFTQPPSPGQQVFDPLQRSPPSQRQLHGPVPKHVSLPPHASPQSEQFVTVPSGRHEPLQQRWPGQAVPRPTPPSDPPQAQAPAALHDSLTPHVAPQAPQLLVENGISQYGEPTVQSRRRGLQEHARAVQAALAPQSLPHAPQFVLVSMLTSHPFDGTPSQSAQPSSQVWITQRPLVLQRGVAWARLHRSPQEAQFITVPSGVSHPSESLPLQSATPVPQAAISQTRPMHVAVAPDRLQVIPHPLQ